MDNIINEKIEAGFLAADAAVSDDVDADASDAILQFHALRREILQIFKTEMSDTPVPAGQRHRR